MGQAIYWAKVESLSPAVEAMAPGPETLIMLERLPLTWLDEAALKSGLRFERFNYQPVNRWERGRLFNPAGELRWEKIDGYFWAVYAGNDTIQLPDPFLPDKTLQLGEPEIRHYYLWGKQLEAKALSLLNRSAQDPVFAEYRAGNILAQYPAPAPPAKHQGRVRLAVADYIDPATKIRLYYRFQGVEWV